MLPFLTFDDAIAALRRGDIIFYPTETSYAIGGDATDTRVAAKIFALKGRTQQKTLPMIVAHQSLARKYGKFAGLSARLAAAHWPGALTLIVPLKEDAIPALAHGVIGEDKTIALRVSAHPVARRLSAKLGRPIIATSANITGSAPFFDPEKIARESWGRVQPAGILSGGVLPKSEPSTIVKIIDNKVEILRRGAIKL